jgi:hypothetical protein
VIYSDDPQNQADWIRRMLKSVGVEAAVSINIPEGFKGTLLCVGYKQMLRVGVP